MGRAVVPPFSPAEGESAPISSWGWLGLEVLADMGAWAAVFLLVTTVGARALTRLSIDLELLVIFGAFALVGLAIRLLFVSLRRRSTSPTRGSRKNARGPGQNV